MLLYIDPGTGSMLFTVLIGVIGAAFYSLRMLLIKIKYAISGGKAKVNEEKIPFVIFSDDKRYWAIFEPICCEMEKRGKDIVYLTFSEDDPALSCQYKNVKAEYIGKGNKAYARLNYLRANIVLATTPGLDVYQWKRSKEVDYYIHILHAPEKVVMYRMFGIDYYDAILLSGEYQAEDVRQLEKIRNLPAKDLHVIGIPYMDRMVERLEKAGPVPEHPTTIMLAPSWGQSAMFALYGGKIIDLLIKTGYNIIVRPHPQSFASEKELMDKLMEEYPESDKLEWNRDSDNFEVLRRADLLITDFSAVMFEFALIYDKPVMFTNPKIDLSPYDAWWLDKEVWTASSLTKLGQAINDDNLDNIKELIDECLNNPSYAEGRKSVKNETWEYMGEGAKRTTDYLIQKYDELTTKEEK